MSRRVHKHETEPTEQERLIAEVCDGVRDLLIRKDHDYGASFSNQFEKRGVLSSLIRMEDKINRLDTLIEGRESRVSDESIEDTVADLAGYALLTLVEMQKGRDDNEPRI